MNPAEIITEAIRLFRQYERDARSNAFRTHKGSDVWKLHDAQRQEAADMIERLEQARAALEVPPVPLEMTPPPGARWDMGDYLRKVRPGWIVGNGNGTAWRAWRSGAPVWVAAKREATRYTRREDAEAVHAEDEAAWTVVWYDPEDGR